MSSNVITANAATSGLAKSSSIACPALFNEFTSVCPKLIPVSFAALLILKSPWRNGACLVIAPSIAA